MLQRIFFALLLLSISILLSSAAAAEEYMGQLCLGFHPESKSWGQVGVFPFTNPSFTHCPENYAMVSSNRPHGAASKSHYVPVLGDCCPLPPDALTDEVRFEERECPEGFVVTGAQLAEPIAACDSAEASCQKAWEVAVTVLRCTKINEQKYTLGPPIPGALVSFGYNFSDMGQHHLTRLQIPVGLRYAVGRFARIGWTLESCVGQIPGSLLQGRTSKRCATFSFRELLHRDTLQTPVRLFPQCRRIKDPLDPATECVTE